MGRGFLRRPGWPRWLEEAPDWAEFIRRQAEKAQGGGRRDQTGGGGREGQPLPQGSEEAATGLCVSVSAFALFSFGELCPSLLHPLLASGLLLPLRGSPPPPSRGRQRRQPTLGGLTLPPTSGRRRSETRGRSATRRRPTAWRRRRLRRWRPPPRRRWKRPKPPLRLDGELRRPRVADR